MVWVSLVMAMTGGAGLLMAMDAEAARGGSPISAPALAATAPASVEGVLEVAPGVSVGRWKAIVIHHSGTPYGSMESLDRQAREMNLRGLGHHFVIGNGSGLRDGEVVAGYRWIRQLPGAHASGEHASWYDRNSIGICLVGDGDRRPFTAAQVRRLAQLVSTLMVELEIPAEAVVLHSEIAPTTDPGWHFPEAALREQLASRG